MRAPRRDERLVVIRRPGGGRIIHLATVTDAAPLVAGVRCTFGGAWPALEWFDQSRDEHVWEHRGRGFDVSKRRQVEDLNMRRDDAAHYLAWCEEAAAAMAENCPYREWLLVFAARLRALADFNMNKAAALWR